MMNNVLLVGGPYDGQTKEIKGKPAVFEIVERRLERAGQMRVTHTSKCRLVSEGDSPPRYQFEDPDYPENGNVKDQGPIYLRRICDVCDALVFNDNLHTTTCSPICTRARAAGRTREQQIIYELDSYRPEDEVGEFCPVCGLLPKECACRPKGC